MPRIARQEIKFYQRRHIATIFANMNENITTKELKTMDKQYHSSVLDTRPTCFSQMHWHMLPVSQKVQAGWMSWVHRQKSVLTLLMQQQTPKFMRNDVQAHAIRHENSPLKIQMGIGNVISKNKCALFKTRHKCMQPLNVKKGTISQAQVHFIHKRNC